MLQLCTVHVLYECMFKHVENYMVHVYVHTEVEFMSIANELLASLYIVAFSNIILITHHTTGEY